LLTPDLLAATAAAKARAFDGCGGYLRRGFDVQETVVQVEQRTRDDGRALRLIVEHPFDGTISMVEVILDTGDEPAFRPLMLSGQAAEVLDGYRCLGAVNPVHQGLILEIVFRGELRIPELRSNLSGNLFLGSGWRDMQTGHGEKLLREG